LGISDDIRPKKYRPLSKNTVKSEIKAADKKIKERDDGQLFQQNHEGGFFDGTPLVMDHKSRIKKTPVQVRPRSRHHWIYTFIITLTFIALVGVVVWQNLDLVKSYISGSYKHKNSQNLNDIISGTNDSLKNYSSSNQTRASATTNAPQAAPVATIDKSTIVISVLNGSGVKNSASSVAATLKQSGFSVKSTGNARSFNYAKTFIYYKDGKQEAVNLVKDTLTGRQTEASLNNSLVGDVYDVVVVVGKN